MTSLKVFIFVTVIFFSLNLSNLYPVFADDDYEEYGEHHGDEEENEVLEEGGELLGWGTLAIAGLAGVIFPLRRSGKLMKGVLKGRGPLLRSLLKFFGRWHITFGVLVLLTGGVHGVVMYIAEGEIGVREYLGIGSVAFILFAAIFGMLLISNRGARVLRNVHMVSLVIAGLLTAVHIALS